MAKRSASLVPAVRPDLSLTPEEADLSSAAVDAFAVALGGRQALLDTLVVADGTSEVHQIVNLLIDPRYGGWSLRRLCATAGLTIADLFTAYKKALLVRAHLQATKVITDNLVAVVDDVMQRSRPREIVCPACAGLTTVTPEPTRAVPNPAPQPCATCRATGRVIEQPDLDRQKVALELAQLLQTRGGITVQQNSVTLPAGGSGAPGALEQLQQAVHEVLYPRRVADAEPAPVSAVDGVVAEEAAP
jgi:hypothetical protein